MASIRPTSFRGLPMPVAACLVVVMAAATPLAARAHSPVDPSQITPGHPTGHVGDRDGLTWPPQPRGIRELVPFSDPGREASSRELQRMEADRDEAAALRFRQVRRALGIRYERVEAGRSTGKGAEPGTRRLVYFSHARNTTVEITLDDGKYRKLRSTPAAEYQPEITDKEIEQAAAIARSHFLQAGASRVAELQAFGILAYKPVGKGFYSTRVLYISFHADSDAPPQYAAWVDLTGGTVLRTREEQP